MHWKWKKAIDKLIITMVNEAMEVKIHISISADLKYCISPVGNATVLENMLFRYFRPT